MKDRIAATVKKNKKYRKQINAILSHLVCEILKCGALLHAEIHQSQNDFLKKTSSRPISILETQI